MGIHVTDHAIVRYCERVLGLNIAEIKAAILTEQTRRTIERAEHHPGKYHGKDCRIVYRDNAVITVLEKRKVRKKLKRLRPYDKSLKKEEQQ